MPLTDVAWLAAAGVPADVRFSIALDGLSLWLFGLTALLMVVAVLISWEAIRPAAVVLHRLLLVLETGMLGVFAARDIILFYLFFEFTLVPLFFLIGIWGSDERRYAAVKFFLFTLSGSVLTFWACWRSSSGIYQLAGAAITFSIPELTGPGRAAHPAGGADVDLPGPVCRFRRQGAAVSPAHLAAAGPRRGPGGRQRGAGGLLLKIGAYGFLRFNLPMLPAAAVACMPWLLWLSVIGILYGPWWHWPRPT